MAVIIQQIRPIDGEMHESKIHIRAQKKSEDAGHGYKS